MASNTCGVFLAFFFSLSFSFGDNDDDGDINCDILLLFKASGPWIYNEIK